MAHTARKASVLCSAALLVAFVCSAHAQCSSTAPRGGSCGSGVCCSSGQCCSKFGFCGSTDSHCGAGCQQSFGTCSGGSSGGSDTPERPDTTPVTPNIPDAGNRGSGVGSIISAQLWNTMFPMRNKAPCQGAGRDFYSHTAFLNAAAATPGFGTSGDAPTNKRELAAFLAHISQETTGGGNTGGLCWIIEGAASGPPADRYCQASAQYPCATGKSYHGRGPIQLSWNYNYISAGKALGFDGLNNPDAVASDPVLAFRTAMWFWMTPQSPKPSAHDVMAGRWTPSAADRAAGRTPGFGVVTNVINGGLECGTGSPSAKEAGRVAYFRRYASLLGVSTGDNLSCASQRPFGA